MKKGLLLVVMVLTLVASLSAGIVTVSDSANEVNVISSNNSETVLEMTLGQFIQEEVEIDGVVYKTLSLNKEAETYKKGAPEVPILTRSIIVDNYSSSELQVISSDYVEYELALAPSKGVITRDMDPTTVPYVFGNEYSNDAFFPENVSSLSSPFIMRNYRGVSVTFNPFQYNPVSGVLRVYTTIKVAVNNTGKAGINTLTTNVKNVTSFDAIYKRHFLNYDETRYAALNEFGSILVIAPQNYFSTMQAYVDWKNTKGIATEMVDIATVGSSANSIRTYIQNYYNTHDDFAFVQIAGDAAQVPTLSVAGGGSDPSFALVAGNDSYPDIFIGRYSAQTTAQLATQINRTIAYERDTDTDADYLNRAMGLASNEGGGTQGDMGESDIAHMNLIRTDLLGYGYNSVDQIYDPGASSTTVGNNVNAGRGFINYVGHGSVNAWSTSGFSVNQVNNLTNVGELPFIVSVACVNGDFVSNTCFAEAWMRATYNGDATGAIAMYASSINQAWSPPMRGEDEITDLLVAEELTSIGGLYYSGSCEMIEAYNASGIETFKTWHIFGDASLQVRAKTPETMTLSHTGILFVGTEEYTVNTGVENALVAVSFENQLLGSGYADATGSVTLALENLPVTPQDLTLTVTAFNKVTVTETVEITPAAGAYVVVNSLPETNFVNGYDGSFALELKNVGVETATELSITLTSDNDDIEFTANEVTVASINADQVITIGGDVLNLTVADGIEDQAPLGFTVTISSEGNEDWVYPLTIFGDAPLFSFGDVMAVETNGNGNNRMDAGETFSLSVPLSNLGHNVALAPEVTLNFPGGDVTVPNNTSTIADLAISATNNVEFELFISSQVAPGTELDFTFEVASGVYNEELDYSAFVGLAVEDFEAQDLDIFGWATTGGTYTFDTNAHEGVYSLKSADISHNGTTTLVVDYESGEAGEISFWIKISTESGYDFVKFYIDGSLQDSWAGDVDWSEQTYNTSAGNHTYKWDFTKDGSVDGGDDCFYLDYVVFPTAEYVVPGTPEIAIDVLDYNFGEVTDTATELDVVINNSGDGDAIASIVTEAPFFLKNSNDELVSSLGVVVDAAGSETVTLVFNPTENGTFTSTATITTDDVDNPTFTLNLEGVAQVTANAADVIPAITSLNGNYPNPFNPETEINFGLAKGDDVKLIVYNILGQKVKTLVNNPMNAGNHKVVWNGKNDSGQSVSSGVYFYRMTTNKYSKTAKMILMK